MSIAQRCRYHKDSCYVLCNNKFIVRLKVEMHNIRLSTYRRIRRHAVIHKDIIDFAQTNMPDRLIVLEEDGRIFIHIVPVDSE